MIAALGALILLAVLIGVAFAIGGAALPVLLVLAGLVVAGWFALAAMARRTPGGPDDASR